jgi:hypothetical protein
MTGARTDDAGAATSAEQRGELVSKSVENRIDPMKRVCITPSLPVIQARIPLF